MSRLAILSDVHADVYALRDALLQIERLGCDAVVCAGDLVDYGPFPEETLALLMECNIPSIRGNHDRCAVLESRADRTWSPSKRAITFLRRLPLAWSARIDGVRVAVHHARPGSDLNGIEPGVTEAAAAALLDDGACDVLVVGHTHLAFERRVAGGGLVCNPGPLLRDSVDPLEIPAAGTFGVLELPSCVFHVYAAATGRLVRHRSGDVKASSGPATRNEAKDHRAYGHHEQQVNESGRDVERKEPKHPHYEKHDCNYPNEIHDN